MKLRALVVAALLVAGCGSSQTGPEDHPGDFLPTTERGARVDRVAITTAVDPVTFAPAAPALRSFSPSTPRLFVCFRVTGADPGVGLTVSWHRRDEEGTLSSSRVPLEGDQWMAAEHVPSVRFYPGAHFVRIQVEGETLAEVEFEIEADGTEPALPSEAQISRFQLVSALDPRGRPLGRSLTTVAQGATEVHAAFTVAVAPPGADVEVHWIQAGRRVGRTLLGRISGRQDLSASLRSDAELPAGLYRVDVVADGQVAHSGSFTVISADGGPAGPRVGDLALTTAIDPRTRRPAAPTLTELTGTETTLYLTLTFGGMPRGERLLVRWLQDSVPDQPMAESTFEVSGRGSLAASFSPDGPLPPDRYHVEVLRAGAVVAALPFTVGPEEAWPQPEDASAEAPAETP